MWPDESKLEIYGHSTVSKVWRKIEEAHASIITMSNFKYGMYSIMVWACLSSSGPGKLKIVEFMIMINSTIKLSPTPAN